MKNPISFVLGVAIIFLTTAASADQIKSRSEIIDRALDCMAKNNQSQEISWSDVCVTGDSEQYAQLDVSTASNYKSKEYPSTYSDNKLAKNDYTFSEYGPKLTEFEVSPEVSYYWYEEPDGASSANFAEYSGVMYGLNAKLTHRISENQHIQSINDVFSDTNKINMFRFEAMVGGGWLDYDSASTGSNEENPNYVFETRGIVGYDIPAFDNSRFTPYAGFGYRYLFDDSGGTSTSTGAVGYDRESNYLYIPIGLETTTHLSSTLDISATIEYDWFLGGKQYSHLEDASSGYNTLRNEQDKGYGVRGSIKLTKITDGPDYFFEPFIRYWNIDDSDIDTITFNGTATGSGYEPANKTTQYGVKAGVNF